KITSKKIAEQAGVSTVPGYTGVVSGTEHALEIAAEIGYPVMLKASAGGGGKGMRVAYNEAECRDGFERATNEARSSFGDDRVFIEKFVTEPRHIEIQVMVDQFGNGVYLGERECSIQRRHQKVIEEAPSPFIDEATRKAMGEQSLALAAAVDYCSAGTVEFIVDGDRNFYFLEMNTRLQVEHPVTELVTGYDLVELMIRVAAGEKLPITQADIQLNGWAMESRVYAENPLRGFLPSTGRLTAYQPPTESDTVRVDTGVYAGGEVSMFYDPMIAKLITYGEDRNTAIDNMIGALDRYHIKGLDHNIPFLNALMSHTRFIEGRLTTNFIAEEFGDGFSAEHMVPKDPIPMLVAAAVVNQSYRDRSALLFDPTRGLHYQAPSDWVMVAGGAEYRTHISSDEDAITVTINDERHIVTTDWQRGQAVMEASINGVELGFQVERQGASLSIIHRGAELKVLTLPAATAHLNQHMIDKIPPDLSKFLLSPMPGLLVKLSVAVGDKVQQGQELAVIEAMKMENSMRAEKDGVVKAIEASEGQSLSVDQVIIEFE
ncbi:MAG: ATP-grasp domain-containing protein, partial [Gammaproteobacteria bacterium]|nr:ATP-grasp domain-containing protein [Gammaproteobacteria bacterium]